LRQDPQRMAWAAGMRGASACAERVGAGGAKSAVDLTRVIPQADNAEVELRETIQGLVRGHDVTTRARSERQSGSGMLCCRCGGRTASAGLPGLQQCTCSGPAPSQAHDAPAPAPGGGAHAALISYPDLVVLRPRPGTCTLGRRVYVGEVDARGMRHGLGVVSWVDGSKYAGEWAADRPSGCGVETYADGSWFAGELMGELRHGAGTFCAADGAVRCVGPAPSPRYHPCSLPGRAARRGAVGRDTWAGRAHG
jgi:hypothetical protein